MKKINIKISLIIVTILILYGCQERLRDNEVKIGKQIWKTENLNVNRFRNGDLIPEAKTMKQWKKAGESKQPIYCHYKFDSINGSKYGKLYNWYAVSDSRGLAPKGWHIPSDAEYYELIDYLGGQDIASVKMKSTKGWLKNGNGNNESGFSGQPGGAILEGNFGKYFWLSKGKNGYWWNSNDDGTVNAWSINLGFSVDFVGIGSELKTDGMSVRCIKDKPKINS